MKTVTGLFDRYDDALAAVGRLESAGVASSDISILANNSDDWYQADGLAPETRLEAGAGTGAGIGALAGGTGGLLTGLGLLAVPGIGPVVAAGWLVATAAGAVAGAFAGGVAGGVIGALMDAGVSETDANLYAEGVRRGGTLVTARVAPAFFAEAETILDQAARVDITARRKDFAEEAEAHTGDTADAALSPEALVDRERYLRDQPD